MVVHRSFLVATAGFLVSWLLTILAVTVALAVVYAQQPPTGWKATEGFGLIVYHPIRWQVDPRLREHVISLNTFESAYGPGGIIPKGGAELAITRTFSKMSLAEIRAKDALGADVKGTGSIRLADNNATLVTYRIPFSSFTYANIIAYLPREKFIYKFSLLYHAEDERGPEFTKEFREILLNVKFI